MSVVSIGRLIDLSSDILIEVDLSFKIRDKNRKASRYLRDGVENFLEIFPEKYRTIVEKLLYGAHRTFQPLSIRVPVITKEGGTSVFYMRVVPVEKGYFVSLKPERQAGLAEEIINSIDYGVVLFDEDTDSIIYRNKYASRFQKALPSIVLSALEKIRNGEGIEKSLEISVDERVFLVHVKPFRRSFNGYILLFRDITGEKKMQELMSMVDRLSSVGIMAASLAHEIRNPLTSVKVLAQTLAQDLSGPRKMMAQKISRQVDRVNELITKLLFYSKPSSSRPRYIRVSEIIREVIDIMRPQADKRGVPVEYVSLEEVELFVDPKDLQQILINLILNALDACEGIPGCRVRIESGMSDVFADTNHKYGYIKVSDSGRGIPQEELERIFYPFYTTKEKGTGLGLYVVHKLVKDNEGIVEVKSAPDTGTEFTLYFKGREVK